MSLKEKARNLPAKPGVYLMKDKTGSVLYVGKAKRLNQRVLSYFLSSTPQSNKNQRMIFHIADFDYQLTDTELEALLLEQALIAKIHPPYNRLMNYSDRYIYLDYNQAVRTLKEPNASSVGPFVIYKKIPELIRIINELYGLKIVSQHSAAALALYNKRYQRLPKLAVSERDEQIFNVLQGGKDGIQRLSLLQTQAIQQQAFEWAKKIEYDKKILQTFQKQALALSAILYPTPKYIWDVVDETTVKLFFTFQGKIINARIIKTAKLSKVRKLFENAKLPKRENFIPLDQLDSRLIVARYFDRPLPEKN